MTRDEQEALSVVYNTQRIVRLHSGNLALFSTWDNDTGIQLLTIGPFEGIVGYIKTAEELHPPRSIAVNLSSLLGLSQPAIRRRF